MREMSTDGRNVFSRATRVLRLFHICAGWGLRPTPLGWQTAGQCLCCTHDLRACRHCRQRSRFNSVVDVVLSVRSEFGLQVLVHVSLLPLILGLFFSAHHRWVVDDFHLTPRPLDLQTCSCQLSSFVCLGFNHAALCRRPPGTAKIAPEPSAGG